MRELPPQAKGIPAKAELVAPKHGGLRVFRDFFLRWCPKRSARKWKFTFLGQKFEFLTPFAGRGAFDLWSRAPPPYFDP